MSAREHVNDAPDRFLTVEVHAIPEVGNRIFSLSRNGTTDDVKQRVVDVMFAAGFLARRPWFRHNKRIWLQPESSSSDSMPQAYFARCPYYRPLLQDPSSVSENEESIMFMFQWTTPDAFRNPPHRDMHRLQARTIINVTD